MDGYEYHGICEKCGADAGGASPPGKDETLLCEECEEADGRIAQAKRGDVLTRGEAESIVRAWLWWQVYQPDRRAVPTRTVHQTLGYMAQETGLSVCRARDILMHMAEAGKVTYEAKQGVGFTVVVKEG